MPRSPSAISARISVLRTGRPSISRGSTTFTSKPSDRPSSARAAGVPPRSWPKAASGVIRKPARSTRSAIAATNYVVRRQPRVLHRSAGSGRRRRRRGSNRTRRSSGSHRTGGAAPTRISSGWWSKVMTAGRARWQRPRPRATGRAGRRGRDGGRRTPRPRSTGARVRVPSLDRGRRSRPRRAGFRPRTTGARSAQASTRTLSGITRVPSQRPNPTSSPVGETSRTGSSSAGARPAAGRRAG